MMREVAEKKAQILGAKLIMGSATPSLYAWSRIESGEISCQKMNQDIISLIYLDFSDLKEEFKAGNYSIFSEELKTKRQINKGIDHSFVNRRGHSSFVMCENVLTP